MEERIEQSWRDFERVGGKKPQPKIGYAKHLETLAVEKKAERSREYIERETSGEFFDYSKGSALHNSKGRRVKAFVKRQLKRAHTLKRFGDPTPLKQAGKVDTESGTLNVFNKTIRTVRREVAHEAKQRQVKERHGSGKTMWDLRGGEANIVSF